MQGSATPALIVDGELLAPPIQESPPKADPPPQVKQPEPPPPPKSEPPPKNEPIASARPDTGVALPVLAAESPAPASTEEYVVKDVPPLAPDEKLPFASRVGTVSLKEYVPSDGPPVEAQKTTNPDGDDEVDMGILSEFADFMRVKASKLASYPLLAAKRGWQGTVRIMVRFNSDGTPRQFSVKDSSGFKLLDEQAMAMMKQAVAGIEIPPKLSGKKFSIIAPIVFKLNAG